MSKTISDLRAALFETLEALKSGAMDLDKARAINEIGKTLIDSAKVEVEFLRVTEGDGSEFLAGEQQRLTHANGSPAWPGPVTRHTLQG
jgi:hypothetical protein